MDAEACGDGGSEEVGVAEAEAELSAATDEAEAEAEVVEEAEVEVEGAEEAAEAVLCCGSNALRTASSVNSLVVAARK